MVDYLSNLTEEQREAIFKWLIPIGHKEGDELHRGEVIDGKFVEDKEAGKDV